MSQPSADTHMGLNLVFFRFLGPQALWNVASGQEGRRASGSARDEGAEKEEERKEQEKAAKLAEEKRLAEQNKSNSTNTSSLTEEEDSSNVGLIVGVVIGAVVVVVIVVFVITQFCGKKNTVASLSDPEGKGYNKAAETSMTTIQNETKA